MRSILSRPLIAILLVLCACAPRHENSAKKDLKLPPAATDNDFYSKQASRPEQVVLGQALFFDKILSGNKNISCATCHSVLAATGDGLSLPIGEEGTGTAIFRRAGPELSPQSERVPRNSPALFNLGAIEFQSLFLAGRVESDPDFPSGVISPAKQKLPEGLDNPLAAQALFPVTSAAEMCGHPGENVLADFCDKQDFGRIWAILEERLQEIPRYVTMFKEAFPSIKSKDEISMVHAANAIAAFQAMHWRADNSPFDQYLRGNKQAMSGAALSGMQIFYGKAGCAYCHQGTFQTDQKFHAVAMPQLGPGKGDGFNNQDDFGRERVTQQRTDRYKFRTPSLRNVALSAPYGHSGAYNSLRGVVIHMLNPVTGLNSYQTAQAILPIFPSPLKPDDLVILHDPASVQQIAEANEIQPIQLKKSEIDLLITFLHALTDPASLDLRRDAPQTVPSGLSIID